MNKVCRPPSARWNPWLLRVRLPLAGKPGATYVGEVVKYESTVTADAALEKHSSAALRKIEVMSCLVLRDHQANKPPDALA